MAVMTGRATAAVTKAVHFGQRVDYLFALRFWLATLLAWWAAIALQLDKPYWAVMTVAVVSYPSQGMLIAKFIARLLGTLIGILMVTALAGISLNAPWLMSIYLALWLAFCTYVAGGTRGMATYGCALCGYTSAIAGFGISVSPSPYNLFFISQARLSEIALGLAAALLVTFLLPSRLDNRLFCRRRNLIAGERGNC
ncbi:FUSC family protein [Acerihabitans sp. KWT182]|uniref:FUSC family protein n=1 Tax=Acerihabitans sp. KWT182 TaxID=3157919 RepID=A0AAU7Q614_9GAMM